MSNQDFRRELNNAFDDISGSPSPALGDRVRSALVEAPERRGPYWIAGVAAAVIAAVIVGVLFVANPLNRHPNTAGPIASPTRSASVSPQASPSPTPSASPSSSASPTPNSSYVCTASTISASNPPLSAYVDAVRTGTHTGYDRVTIEFQNGQPGTINLQPQSGTTFTSGGGQGTVYTLAGQNGVLVGFNSSDAHTAYSGPTDFKTGYSKLVEVRQIEDFEGYVQFALGIAGPACYHASILTNPVRLVIDIQVG